jgi:hypothetical protein
MDRCRNGLCSAAPSALPSAAAARRARLGLDTARRQLAVVRTQGYRSPRPQHDHLDHRTTMPARIVTSTYRYKRPPRKRKAVPLEVPAIVRKRAPLSQQASAADKVGDDRPAQAPANDVRKPVIVTVKRRSSRFGDVPDMTPEEHRQRGDAADALFREIEIVRQATGKD